MLYGQARRRIHMRDFMTETCVMLFPVKVMRQPVGGWGGGGSEEVCGEEWVSDRDTGEKGWKYVTSSVAHGPVALGDGVRDVMEGGEHQAEGFVGEVRHIL